MGSGQRKPSEERLFGGDQWALTDALGSITGLVSNPASTGRMDWHATYDEFGQPMSPRKFDPSFPQGTSYFGFTGEQHDFVTGLTYLRNRYYAPGLGRFTSPDPLGTILGDPTTLNRYGYVMNNPLRWVDPWGLGPMDASTAGDYYYGGYLDDDTWFVGQLLRGGPYTAKVLFKEQTDAASVSYSEQALDLSVGSVEVGVIEVEADYRYGGASLGAIKAQVALEMSDRINLGFRASLVEAGVSGKVPIPIVGKTLTIGIEGHAFSVGVEFKVDWKDGFEIRIGLSAIVGGSITLKFR